ncbi:MAG: hypothetical protein H6551_01705 [Chitinophagales bacterium]|nr:hypothetical protein [Chitinophagaceae bacterium]MCB9063840.1 hypothetical protein [Chitinophagales bacterium]
MLNDKTTFKDLSIFPSEGSGGIIGLIDRTTTDKGREVLYDFVSHPPDTYDGLVAMQEAVRYWRDNQNKWPTIITNGTLVMLDKYFEASDGYTHPPSGVTLFFGDFWQKLFNKGEYFFTQFSISHVSDILKGGRQLLELLQDKGLPILLRTLLEDIQSKLDHRLTADLLTVNSDTPYREHAKYSFYVRREMKSNILGMMKIYAKLDAIQSLGRATGEHGWAFPELKHSLPVCFKAKGLFHPLLKDAKPYDIEFTEDRNFLILTGANMSGKTTFMRSIGVAALLAHIGMGVPASNLEVSFMDGIVTNMHVEDDLLKGESYFYAEVKRMKMTAGRLQKNEPHLVLMDELFKGTNVHDAYECTAAVIEGLLNQSSHLMVLSTHLYEVAKKFADRKEVQFAYFVTETGSDEDYYFDYKLKEGISNDRIGYKILQREGVLQLLNRTDK